MKRSRAVEIINRKIEGYMNPSSSRHVADLILMDLEEAGFQPPKYFDIEYYDEPECDGFIGEWEKE
jgi:hypothetical protein